MKYLSFILSLSLIIIGCRNNSKEVLKNHKNDPFRNSMEKSEFFQMNGYEDKIFKSKNGTIIYIPNDAFLDADGNKISGNVEIEYAEIKDIDKLILSNTIMHDSSSLYQTQQAFFINATSKGKQLKVNPQHPIYIEVASESPVKIYHGIRNEKGKTKWRKGQDAVKYLIPVPLEMLDFYPPGFVAEVERNLPYKSHTQATSKLIDSLFYSFSLTPLNSNKITILSRIEKTDSTSKVCGINPASIQTIKNKNFQNTLISTREFETKLKDIFATCDNEILELYITNLNKNLWEIDSIAAEKLGKQHPLYKTFRNYAALKQTTVEISTKKTAALSNFFYEQRLKNEQKINVLREDLQKKIEKHEKIVMKKTEEYRELLVKRHQYRMKKFGFELTEMGWYSVAQKIQLKDVEKFKLYTKVVNGNGFDQVYVYVVNAKIKSIFSLLSDDNVNFTNYFAEDPDLLLWKNQVFYVIGVGFKDGKIAYNIVESTQKPITNVEFALQTGHIEDFLKKIKSFTQQYNKENKITIDIEYQNFFYQEQQRLKKEKAEELFRQKLRNIVFPCYKAPVVFNYY